MYYAYIFLQNSNHYLNDSVSVFSLFTFVSVRVVLITWCVGREKGVAKFGTAPDYSSAQNAKDRKIIMTIN